MLVSSEPDGDAGVKCRLLQPADAGDTEDVKTKRLNTQTLGILIISGVQTGRQTGRQTD